jgi:hypothetical protein
VLGVDGDGLAGQLGEVDAVAAAVEGQLETVVQGAFGAHALADAGLVQDVHRALFEHAGADRGFDLGPGARFEHDRFDALQVQQVGKQQAGRAGADDGDLGAHGLSPCALLVCLHLDAAAARKEWIKA